MLPESVITPGNNTRYNKFALLLFVLLVLNILDTTAQQNSFRFYTKNDGLISNHIQSTFQDDDGFTWFASFGDISIYDGHQFMNYTAENGEISVNIVFGFFKKSKDETWVIENSVTEVFVKRTRVRAILIKGYELSNYLQTKDGKVLAAREQLIVVDNKHLSDESEIVCIVSDDKWASAKRIESFSMGLVSPTTATSNGKNVL